RRFRNIKERLAGESRFTSSTDRKSNRCASGFTYCPPFTATIVLRLNGTARANGALSTSSRGRTPYAPTSKPDGHRTKSGRPGMKATSPTSPSDRRSSCMNHDAHALPQKRDARPQKHHALPLVESPQAVGFDEGGIEQAFAVIDRFCSQGQIPGGV